MVPFFVMIKCQLARPTRSPMRSPMREIASEVYSTSGDYDLLVKFYVDDGSDIGHFVNEKVHPIDGIQDTKPSLPSRPSELRPGNFHETH